MTRARSSEAPLEIDTLIVAREMEDGDWLAFPLGDPALVSYGAPDACLAEQRLFLSEHLAHAEPEVLARFSFPTETHLHEVDVAVARDDLPRALQIETPLRIPCAVIPHESNRWVVVLPLLHTFHLTPRDELDPAIRAEVQRVCRARQMSPQDYLRLLPARSHQLVRVTVSVARGDGAAGRGGRKELAERRRRKEAVDVLLSVGRALHEDAASRPGPPFIGREQERDQLAALLGGKERLSLLLVGPERSGKSALLREWLRRQWTGRRGRPAFATSGARLIAGMSGLGQWQERVRRVLGAAEALDAVLCFESMSDLAADRPEGWVDLPGAFKRALEERQVRIVGEVTPESLEVLERRHPGFAGCFHKVHLASFSAQEAATVLESRIRHCAAHEPERPNVTLEAVPTLIDLVDRYLPYGAYPGKAVRLLEEVRAAAEALPDPVARSAGLGPAAVFEAFSRQSGIPVFLLRDDVPLKAAEVEGNFRTRLIGQEHAVRRIVETVSMVKASLQPAGKPLASFLFVGPTGVGKTELAKCLAAFLFGSAERMVRVDMTEYQDASAPERLIRGTDRLDGLLTRRVRQQPFCVLLLDEIEKAHPGVFDLLLQVLGEGRLSDARGRTADFRNAIIIMTSNLASAHRDTTIGLQASGEAPGARYEREVERHFRPEFVNRIDRIIPFAPLAPEELHAVAAIAARQIAERRGLQDAGIPLDVSPQALAGLARGGGSAQYGARALRRHLEEQLVSPVARLLCQAGAAGRGGLVTAAEVGEAHDPDHEHPLAHCDGSGLRLTLWRRSAAAPRRDARGVVQIATLRRAVDGWFHLPPVDEVEHRIEQLVVQLSQDRGARRGRREAALAPGEIAALQEEHHRLREVYEAASSARGELHAVEELALAMLVEGQDGESLMGDAETAAAAFRRQLLPLLIAQQRGRDAITLLLQDPQARVFGFWIRRLRAFGERRGWSLTFHVDRDHRGRDERWPGPDERRWGPPREAGYVEELLTERPMRSLILRCRGLHAGAMLAAEAGLHRFLGESDEIEPAHLVCRRLCLRDELAEKDWERAALKPARFKDPLAELKPLPALREHDPVRCEVRLQGGRRTLRFDPSRYWDHLDEIVLEQLLLCLEDRSGAMEAFEGLFTGVLDAPESEDAEEDE
jgi:ATP-dependent Clp protease ATP-binding subunit ClpC